MKSSVTNGILTLLADTGPWHGSYANLAREAHPTNPASAQTELRKIEAAGYVTALRVNNRVQTVALTPKGYQRLGLTPPAQPRTLVVAPDRNIGPPDNADEDQADLVSADDVAAAAGPIERRPFDPERARAGAVNGL